MFIHIYVLFIIPFRSLSEAEFYPCHWNLWIFPKSRIKFNNNIIWQENLIIGCLYQELGISQLHIWLKVEVSINNYHFHFVIIHSKIIKRSNDKRTNQTFVNEIISLFILPLLHFKHFCPILVLSFIFIAPLQYSNSLLRIVLGQYNQ